MKSGQRTSIFILSRLPQRLVQPLERLVLSLLANDSLKSAFAHPNLEDIVCLDLIDLRSFELRGLIGPIGTFSIELFGCLQHVAAHRADV